MRFRLGRFAANALLVIVAVIATVGALELGIRVFRPQKGFSLTVNAWDRELGTRHVPGARGFVRNPDYSIDLVINSKGLRDREFSYEKPESTTRILVLGDSFTVGYGVQVQQTFSKILEALLNAESKSSWRWEVLNLGVGSTGTAHQYALFTREGYKYDPDFVLLCFCQANDYWDNIICGLYTLEDGELVKHDAPRTASRTVQIITRWVPGYRSLLSRSHLLNFVKARTARYHFRELAERQELPDGVAAVEEQEREMTRALVLALNNACKDRDCCMVMTAVPDATRGYVYHDETLELAEFARSHGIYFVSLSEALGDAVRSGLPVNFENDLHWNATGHEVAGRVLSDYFASRAGVTR